MGFADFLATVGQGRPAGRVGEYFGGTTPGQRALSDFIDNELPKYAQSIEATTDPRELEKIGLQFMGAASKSGMPVAAVEKVMDLLIEPARKGLNVKQAGDVYGQMASEMSPMSEPRPQGVEGPLNASGAFLERPGRQPHAGDAMRLAETEARTGVKIPAHLAGLLQAPSVIQENTAQAGNYDAMAGKHKTEQNLAEEAARERRGLPDTPIGNTGMSLRQLGLSTEGRALGTVASGQLPGPLHDENRRRIESQTRASDQAAGASSASQSYTRAREEDLRAGGGRGAGESVTETVTDLTPDAIDIELILQKAQDEGINTPEGLRALAARYNYDVEGTPDIAPGGWFTKPKIGGQFSLKPKPKTSTRTTTKPGNQPAPRQAAPAAPAMAAMPPASQHKGRTIRDTETGISYTSDGQRWIPR